MTTIKLIPSVMEFDVSLDSASMPSLFSQSLETQIIEEVTRQVDGRIPAHGTVVNDVATTMMEDRDYTRKVRNWVLESIDYSHIVMQVRDNIDYNEIVNLTSPLWDNDGFSHHLLSNNSFRNMVNTQVMSNIDMSTVREMADSKIESMTSNIANEVAEKVLKLIQTHL